MDGTHFDRFTIAFSRLATRRSTLALLSALGTTALVAEEARAVCLANGERCDPNASPNGCCSGKCSRRRKKCRPAPNQSICTIDDNICDVNSPACDATNTGACVCFVTSRGFSFCGALAPDCATCTSDADCVKRPEGQRGDRCVEAHTRCCQGIGERLCVRKCPNPTGG